MDLPVDLAEAAALCRWAQAQLAAAWRDASPVTSCAISRHGESWRLNVTVGANRAAVELVPDDVALVMRPARRGR